MHERGLSLWIFSIFFNFLLLFILTQTSDRWRIGVLERSLLSRVRERSIQGKIAHKVNFLREEQHLACFFIFSTFSYIYRRIRVSHRSKHYWERHKYYRDSIIETHSCKTFYAKNISQRNISHLFLISMSTFSNIYWRIRTLYHSSNYHTHKF